jgi:uncharacterized protein CbrC (UPF0167 family)
MYEWHAHHVIKLQRGYGNYDANGSIIRWCFADAELADRFAAEFKGTMLLPATIL